MKEYKKLNAKQEIGRRGEAIAVDYLKNLGHEILEQNWRFSKAEIDIISKYNDILVFTEVKTRSYDFFGSPDAFVSRQQETLVIDAANRYMEQIQHDWEIRFDIIAIIISPLGTTTNHIKDAFFGHL